VLMNKLAALLICLVLIVSCKTNHNIQVSGDHTALSTTLKKENTSQLLSKLKSRKLNFHWLSAHFTMDMQVDSTETSFGGVVRMKKDSIVWMSISKIGIEGVRALLNLDTAMFMDRINDRYFKGNYDYIDSLLETDIDFELIQAVMMGTSIDFYNDTAKLRGFYDGKSQYVLSTIRKRNIKRAVFRNRHIRSKEDAQIIWFDTKDYHINRIRVEDFANHRTFDAYYDDFQAVDSVMFPMHIQYVIAAGKTIKIDLKYKKLNFQLKEETPFAIPAKYARIQY